MKMPLMKVLRAECSQGMRVIFRCRNICLSDCYPESTKIKICRTI